MNDLAHTEACVGPLPKGKKWRENNDATLTPNILMDIAQDAIDEAYDRLKTISEGADKLHYSHLCRIVSLEAEVQSLREC